MISDLKKIKIKMFDPYNVFLAIAIPQWLKIVFVVQVHIYFKK